MRKLDRSLHQVHSKRLNNDTHVPCSLQSPHSKGIGMIASIWNCPQGVRGVLKSLKFSCIKFKALKSLKLYKKVLIMISRGLKFGDGKTRIAIWLNVTIKLQKAMISLNKHEHCTFKVRCCCCFSSVFAGKTVIFQPKATPAGRE